MEPQAQACAQGDCAQESPSAQDFLHAGESLRAGVRMGTPAHRIFHALQFWKCISVTWIWCGFSGNNCLPISVFLLLIWLESYPNSNPSIYKKWEGPNWRRIFLERGEKIQKKKKSSSSEVSRAEFSREQSFSSQLRSDRRRSASTGIHRYQIPQGNKINIPYSCNLVISIVIFLLLL